MLEFVDFSLKFRDKDKLVTVVKKLNLKIEKGERFALVGESGSGKSVTAMSVLRLLPEATVEGKIYWNNIDLLSKDTDIRTIRGKKISMIFQEPMSALNPVYTVGEQISEALNHLTDLNVEKKNKRVLELLELTGIDEPARRAQCYPHELSGGQRQRVLISMALACEPDLLIADEPTTALDVTIRQQVMELLYSTQKTRQMSILLITHDLPLVESFAERVGVMKNGKMIECERKKDLFAQPQHEYTRLLLNSRPTALNAPFQKREVLLEARNISCFYKIKKGLFTSRKMYPVSDESFVIYKGETLGVVGESGSGKTSLGMTLLRLFPGHSYGTLRFGSEEYSTMGKRDLFKLRRKIQMVFQDPFSSLSPRMTIFEILEEGLSLHFPSLSNSDKEKKCSNVIEEVGLTEDHLERYPHQFSGGQRQRISLARALVIEPELLVLDEPTSALDVSVQKQIIDLLLNLQRKRNLTYFFISHDLAVIRALAHRLLVMRYGKVLEFGLTSHVLSQPKHDYTCSLLDAAFAHERA
ncbi:MAG: ABC transporter ATP-binding protein [Burkholderiaceae bacterium]|nr:MAG: ABC transporter ATP-binding protein [Burkholderiaceae bacterium]